MNKATGAAVTSVQGWVDHTCDRIGQAKRKVVRDSIDRLIKEAGGKPFDCDALPNSEQCKNDLGKWAAEAWEHLEVTYGYCAAVCGGLEFQGGYLM